MSFCWGPQRPIADQLRPLDVVVLSPHRDDACLSLGSLLLALGHGVVVNLFTRSLWAASLPKASRSESVVEEIRDTEDRAFIARCGLDRRELRLPEPGIEGRNGFDRAQIELDIQRLTEPLMLTLNELATTPRARKAVLFCPAGIGGHVNHLATLEMVLRNADAICPSYDLMFYEDLPYAAGLGKRLAGLARLRRRLGSTLLRRHARIVPWHEKKRLVDIYASQFRRPLRVRHLRPFAARPLMVHEAFWSVVGDGVRQG